MPLLRWREDDAEECTRVNSSAYLCVSSAEAVLSAEKRVVEALNDCALVSEVVWLLPNPQPPRRSVVGIAVYVAPQRIADLVQPRRSQAAITRLAARRGLANGPGAQRHKRDSRASVSRHVSQVSGFQRNAAPANIHFDDSSAAVQIVSPGCKRPLRASSSSMSGTATLPT